MDGDKKRPVLKSAEELKGKKADVRVRRPKWPLLIALVVLAVGCWALVNRTTLLQKPEEAQPTAAPSTRATLIDRDASEFDQVTISGAGIDEYTLKSLIEYDEEGKAIEKGEGEPRYVVPGDEGFKLDELPVDRIAQESTKLTAQSTVVEDAADLSIYGLSAPQLSVRATYRDGSQVALHFGDQLPSGTNYYLRMDDQSAVYVASSSSFNYFNKTLNQLHQVKLPITLDATKAIGVLIEQTGKSTVEIEHSEDPNSISINSLWMRQPYQIEAHVTRGSELMEAIAAIQLSAYAGHADAPEALAQYGLDVPRAHIVYRQQEGEVLDMRIGAKADETLSYCAIDASGDVYTVQTALLNFLDNATPAKLVDQFAGLVNIAVVDSVTVEGGGATHQLGIDREPITNEDGTEGTNETYTFDGAPAVEKPFKGLYQEIIGLVFDRLREGDDQPGAALATVTFKLNNDQPDVVIEYLEYDPDYCLIRNGERELFLIKRGKVLAMLDACAQFSGFAE